jgi:hypothetical protein
LGALRILSLPWLCSQERAVSYRKSYRYLL